MECVLVLDEPGPTPHKGVRSQVYGISHGLTNSPPDCLLPSLCSGRPFDFHILLPKKRHPVGCLFFWSRVRESNPPSRLGKPLYYRYTNPASGPIITEVNGNFNCFLSKTFEGRVRTLWTIVQGRQEEDSCRKNMGKFYKFFSFLGNYLLKLSGICVTIQSYRYGESLPRGYFRPTVRSKNRYASYYCSRR